MILFHSSIGELNSIINNDFYKQPTTGWRFMIQYEKINSLSNMVIYIQPASCSDPMGRDTICLTQLSDERSPNYQMSQTTPRFMVQTSWVIIFNKTFRGWLYHSLLFKICKNCCRDLPSLEFIWNPFIRWSVLTYMAHLKHTNLGC